MCQGDSKRRSTNRKRGGQKPKALDARELAIAHEVRANDRSAVCAICGLLVLAVFLVFGQTTRYEFINYDDNEYVYDNPHVLGGLNREGVVWAFRSRVSAQWTPLTLISLMADAQLFLRPGPDAQRVARLAGGMHAVNVALHAANAVLIFLVLRALTASLWPSALAAAIFAVHPLHVESVAWITERKDVLSGLLGLLALAAYARYARRPSIVAYLTVAVALALGLLAKPILVTWPLVLLLLDDWPLRRPFGAGLLLEKVPLFVLVAACGIVAYQGQQSGDTVFSLEAVPFPQRIARAAELYVVYLGKTFWPVNLAALYPEAPMKGIWPAEAAGALLVLLTAAAWWATRRGRRWLAVGWLWYLLTLAPVIGFVRVGSVVMANRFLYLPQIGLCIALAWTADEVMGTSTERRRVFAIGSLLVVLVLGIIARRQASYWKDSVTLWTHTLACTSGTWAAHNNLGIALDRLGRHREAIEHFHKGLEIRPAYAQAHFNLGVALANDGQFDKAASAYRAALLLDPGYLDARINLGLALDRCGQFHDAVAELDKAIELKQDSAAAHNSLGTILARNGKYADAIQQFQIALRIQPDFAEACANLDIARGKQAWGGGF
jgi:tetratricopeptide (TPR) repeat protein